MQKKLVFIGGHHNSALATLEWLRKDNVKLDFVWIGRKYISHGVQSPEYIEVTEHGIPFYNLNTGKFVRFPGIRYIFKLIYNLLLIPLGFIQALYLLLKIKPDLIVSFGGFMAVPVVLTGKLLGIPSVTHEQTVVIGLANKIISRFVMKVYTSWPIELYNVGDYVADKVVYTGLPLRRTLFKKKSKYVFDRDLPTVYITGGKSGSLFINKLVIETLEQLVKGVNIIWSTGKRHGEADFAEAFDSVQSLSSEYKNDVIVKEYYLEEDIGHVYHASDFLVTRAGGHTIYELAVLDKPAVLIPIPWTSNNEQVKNADLLVKLGLGIVLNQNALYADTFVNEVLKFSKTLDNYHVSSKVKLDGKKVLGKEILSILSSSN